MQPNILHAQDGPRHREPPGPQVSSAQPEKPQVKPGIYREDIERQSQALHPRVRGVVLFGDRGAASRLVTQQLGTVREITACHSDAIRQTVTSGILIAAAQKTPVK